MEASPAWPGKKVKRPLPSEVLEPGIEVQSAGNLFIALSAPTLRGGENSTIRASRDYFLGYRPEKIPGKPLG